VVELDRTRPPRRPRPDRESHRTQEPFQIGREVRDRAANRTGTILDLARQYSHPKAEPVFSYLIRWDDGQVQAFSEQAFSSSHGLELVD
jgi:hypothetical protein